MTIIRQAIRYPVTTAVGVILVVLFGGIALSRIPVQLTPNVEEPEITVTTVWPGASPQEVEREIIEEQEEQLKSIEGLVEMKSSSQDGWGTVTLTFQVGTRLETALLLVSNRLEQVPQYPDDAEKPVIRSVDVAANAIAWLVLEPAGENAFAGDVSTLYDFADDFIKPELERVTGIAASNIFGGRTQEMHVIVDPERLAARRVTVTDLAAALERENRNYSGGDFDEGKRRYLVRTVGEYAGTEDIENIVIAVRDGVPVYLRDVGRAELGHRKAQAQVFQKGGLVLALNAVKEPGANVLEVMEDLKDAVRRLNAERLAPRGLELWQVYDETDYIDSAIGLVRQSLLVGGILAISVLLVYLRSLSSTLVIAVAIPISLVGAFLLVYAFGRTLNVISLAGMAFAVGMVVDNSIVVLENVYRHRQMGKSRREAAHDGASEVWGAVLASTLTTIAVFVPVLFIREEVGQLFGDIALAISCAVGISLVVSVTVIPSLSARILTTAGDASERPGFVDLWGGLRLARGFAGTVADAVFWMTGSVFRRVAVVVVLVAASIAFIAFLTPKTEYLPTGNQNFLFGFLLPAPGYNLRAVASLEDVFEDELAAYWAHPAGSPEARRQPGGGIRNFFFVALNDRAFMGARSNDPLRVQELVAEFRRAAARIPGSIFVMSQRSLFERGQGEGRNIDIEIAGPDLERLIELGSEVFGGVMRVLPEAQARPIPSLDLGNPEVRVVVDRRRAADLGISNRELGFTVSALVDGAKASDYLLRGKEMDLKLMAGHEDGELRTHLLDQMPIATPDGRLVTLGAVAEVSLTEGPVTINHSERERTITIQVTPSETTALQTAMEAIESEILAPMRDAGKLGGLYQVRLSGAANKLARAGRVVAWNFLLALAITYLVMAALFESFLHPLAIMFSVPLAAMGGVLGLAAVNAFLSFQALDVLTMLGFIILVGTVVNNPILIVHQSLNHLRNEGMTHRDAIREAVRNRIRPIFMSVMTSVFGMLPLVLFPGAGSELYRGLGGVVVGGLLVSTVFTLFLVPALFSLGLDARAALASLFRGH